MQSILLMNGFNVRFPEEVEAEADQLPDSLSESDFADRRDFRGITTFTIDPATAKDFDDALSIDRSDDGTIEIGVHIADVTHFVKPGTEIDKEAYRRSTSVYLVDRVAPMLPEKLSNELCSLRPHEDSLCFSAVFKFDSNGNILHRWFGRTIIHSDHRFAYEEAQEVLETGEGPFSDEMRELNRLAHILRKRKLDNGALTFETDEVQFVLDEHGVPLEIYVKERKEAHMLIEDFMLLANKEVARFIGETRAMDHIPFVYRIHDHPDPEKIAELASFARMLGFEMRIDTPRQVAKSFNALAEAARDDEALQILEPLAIRSMAKAEYNTENIGHYGLAFTFYTHFTSPIRRYSDVLVHRILYENIDGRMKRWNMSELGEQCKHISDMERRAQKAERDSIKYKQAEYMKQFVGQEFEGHISGMIDKGIFVKIDATHAEGLIGFNNLPEPFSLDASGMVATGLHSGDQLKMGDDVRVRILDAIPEKRQIEMELV
jgi:ribonuclease R